MNRSTGRLMSALLVAIGLVPTVAWAQDENAAADALAAVPAVQYRSVFRETVRGIELGKKDWRQANETVGQFRRGHIDILRQEQSQSAGNLPSGSAHRH